MLAQKHRSGSVWRTVARGGGPATRWTRNWLGHGTWPLAALSAPVELGLGAHRHGVSRWNQDRAEIEPLALRGTVGGMVSPPGIAPRAGRR